jgi:hypothetical protein
MGTAVGRIEKEFVFKSLVDEGAACEVHGRGKEIRCRFTGSDDRSLSFAPLQGVLEGLPPGEEVRVFFYLKNNHHTFSSTIIASSPTLLTVEQPRGVYKNLQRKYERVRLSEEIEVSFSMSGRRIELAFPKSDRYGVVEPPQLAESFDTAKINELVKGFRDKMSSLTSLNRITMFRDRMPRAWEERVMVRLGKCLWIPSTEDDFPAADPFPDERVITKTELSRLEQESGVLLHVVMSKLGNILYEKAKKNVFSELYCPILYNEYVVGYIHLANTTDRRERISRDLLDQVYQFGKILCWSLVKNGYFTVEGPGERKFEAPIIDLSASGILFAHSSADLARELLVHTDVDLTIRIRGRAMVMGARIMRKLKDVDATYFGALFLRMQPEDLRFLFEYLYGKPFDEKYESIWEGGAPPPPVML